MSTNNGGYKGPEAELMRQISYSRTMIHRTQEKADRKKQEYADKVLRLEQELWELRNK